MGFNPQHGDLIGLGNDDHPQYLLIDGSRAMAGDLDMGGNDVINVGLVDGVDVSAHAARHVRGGADLIDADRLTITWSPSNYTRDPSPPEAGNVTDLTAHLAGIDNALASATSEDWATTLAAGNVSGGTDPTLSNGDDLRAAVAGGSDLGPVGNEFGTLRLVDDAIVGGDVEASGQVRGVGVLVNADGSNNSVLTLNESGGTAFIRMQDSGILRFAIIKNAGNTFAIQSYDGSGVFQNNLITSTGGSVNFGVVAQPSAAGGQNLGASAVPWGSLFLQNTVQVTRTGAGAWGVFDRGGDYTIERQMRDAGVIRWIEMLQNDANNDAMQWRRYDAAGAFLDIPWQARGDTGDIMLSGRLFGSGAGVSGSDPTYDDLVLGTTGGAASGITLRASAVGISGVAFEDPSNNIAGLYRYSHNGNFHQWYVDGTAELLLYASDLRPQVPAGLAIGTPSLPFNRIYLESAIDLGSTTGAATFNILKNTANFFGMNYLDGGTFRWQHQFSTGEALLWRRHDGTGAYQDTPMTMETGGDIIIANRLGVSGGTPSAANTGADDLVVGATSAPNSGITILGDVGYIMFGDTAANNIAQWRYNHAAGRFEMIVEGSSELYFTTGGIIPVVNGGQNLGNASGFAFGTAFLSDTLAYTGSSGIVSVNGTDTWVFGADRLRPNVNAGQGIGSAGAGIDDLFFANSATPTIPSSANAAVYSSSTDSRLRSYYASGQTHRLDQAPFLTSYTLFDGTPENALNFIGDGFAAASAISGTDQQRAEYNFVAPYDCRILVHCSPTDSLADSFGTMVCRVYGDYDTGAGDIDSDSINWNSTSGVRTYEFSTVFSGGQVYGITLQPGASDTSYVNVIVELAAA